MGTIVETNLSLRDYRQNIIVKKVSSWAAIIAAPAMVTGCYGMNVPYPRIGQDLGGCGRLQLPHGGGGFIPNTVFGRRDWL